MPLSLRINQGIQSGQFNHVQSCTHSLPTKYNFTSLFKTMWSPFITKYFKQFMFQLLKKSMQHIISCQASQSFCCVTWLHLMHTDRWNLTGLSDTKLYYVTEQLLWILLRVWQFLSRKNAKEVWLKGLHAKIKVKTSLGIQEAFWENTRVALPSEGFCRNN